MSDRKTISSLTGPEGLGLDSLLVFDDSRSFYHLKGVVSEKQRESLMESAKAIQAYHMESNSAYAEMDARLAKSTLLRLSILLRNSPSTSIFPNLEYIQIDRPISLNILPLLLSGAVESVHLEDWDYANRANPSKETSKVLLENDLIQFLKTLANTASGWNFLSISKSASLGLLGCVPAFLNLTHFKVTDLDFSGRQHSVQCVFDVTRKLPKLEILHLAIREGDFTLDNPPSSPHQLALRGALLILPNAGYKVLRQYFQLTVTVFAHFVIIGKAADGVAVPETEIIDFIERVSDSLARLPCPMLGISCDGRATRSCLPIPATLFNQMFNQRLKAAKAVEWLTLDGWALDVDQLTQAFGEAAIECKKQNAGQQDRLEHLKLGIHCVWQGLPLQALISVAIVYPRLQRLESAIRLEPPPFPSGWDTSQLAGSDESPLTDLVVFDPNPNGAEPSLEIQDLVAITKYLKKVFPKLETITCKTKQEGWSLVKDLLDMATSR